MKSLRLVSLTNTVVMFLAVIWGAWVTSSDSGDGCGAHWPLCKGTFMPDWDYAAIVEFGHRVISGLAGLLSLILLVWIFRALPADGRLKRLAFGTLFFVSFQGALGAAAVLRPQPDLVMALHFGFSLLCFTFALLVTVALGDLARGAAQLGSAATVPPEGAVSPEFRSAVWGMAVYTYLVIYLGAYVRHMGASMACTGWPLCNGELWPTLYGPVGANFAHRLGAALAVLLVIRLWFIARRTAPRIATAGHAPPRADLRRAVNWALVLMLAQVASGALFPLGYLNLLTQLLHTSLIAGFWGVLSYLCYLTLPAGRPAVAVSA
ncbi:cytochrome c oxidase assembly protein subunit 15 [Symbiobacterium terraclitae]|uniref:Cytochrome c oxidase assembly protein subunit 15 n=1 Tax=Symbiobacterium terraclitae TaxID=557451 RepID=A0ABS4JVQ4_9FIRM|nr:cytochrome c oxidase assembly protein subunit 15 [Symbiobacterium terraclitae]